MRNRFPAWFVFSFSVLSTFSVAMAQQGEPAKVLAGTTELVSSADQASEMVDGIDRYLLRALAASVDERMQNWPKPAGDANDTAQYKQSVQGLRDELRMRIGMVDARPKCERFELATRIPLDGKTGIKSVVAQNDKFSIYAIRWHVLEGVEASALMVVPQGDIRFNTLLIPDAGQTPEQLCGLTESSSVIALEIASRGGVVVVPDTIRRNREARNNRSKMTDQEYLYRSAFVLGRHIIGYQVHEISAAVDVLKATYADKPTFVCGWGEGGWLSLFAAAVDTRIDGSCVSGHFGPREGVWDEPIHRNVHGLLNRFGDAQLAALVAPRALVIDAVAGPTVDIPGEGGAPATLKGPSIDVAQSEYQLAVKLLTPWSLQQSIQWVQPDPKDKEPIAPSVASIDRMLSAAKVESKRNSEKVVRWNSPDLGGLPSEEIRRLESIGKWNRFQQAVLERSATERDQYWSKLDTSTLEKFQETVKPYFDFFRQETIGDWEWKSVPPSPRTRLIYQEPKWLGYEVVLDVHDEVFAYGVLLIPRDGKPLTNRPCVVFQHGLEGRPKDTIEGDHPAYHDVSRQLVEQGYIVFAPQHPYLFQDRFRTLQRKSNPLGKTLFSTMVAQHRQLIQWLSSRAEIDPKRIAFYGLSYGGKSAMRIPALVPEYCLSICSADFNDWVWKNASTTAPYSYVWTNEYEIFEFGLGNHFNYAEMAALIAPRPFMVERGHFDNVAPDERVALEFAKVNKLYSARLGIGAKCEIEWFVGPHTINGKGTFEFLKKHLEQPSPK